MKKIHISVSTGIRGNAANKTYSTQAEITSLDELKQAVQYDHVAGMFRNNERSNEKFIATDCVMMDCDNEASDNPGDWLNPEKLHDRLADVPFYVIYSKSHMIDKKDKTARPRFHVYFPLSRTITEAGHVGMLKEMLLKEIPEFDGQAKDAARFFYGVDNPQGVMFEGTKCVDEVISVMEFQNSNDMPRKENIAHALARKNEQQAPAMNNGNSNADEGRVIAQFMEFLYSVVRPLYPLTIIPDGQIHRFETQEDAVSKNTGKAGSYCLHMDGTPAGWVKDYRGETYKFTYDYSPEERREYGRRNSQQRAHEETLRRETERKKQEILKLHEQSKEQARKIALAEYRASSDDLSANGYFRARFLDWGISIKDLEMTRYKESYVGHEVKYTCEVIRQYPLRVCEGTIRELLVETPTGFIVNNVTGVCKKGELIVPFINAVTGEFQTLQRINHEGQKCFYPGLSPKGAAFVMWPLPHWREDLYTPQTDIDTVHTVFVCEGVCTALALWQDMNANFPVYSVGSRENFEAVCAGLKKALSKEVKIIIVADNDDNGAGLKAAEKCKEKGLANGIRLPEITGQDWYDIFITEHKKGVKA